MAAQTSHHSLWPNLLDDRAWYYPPKATIPPSQSQLLTLPPELRNDIYTLVLNQPQAISITLMKNTPKLLSHKKNLLALTRVSRQIRSECLRLFYTLNRFSLHTDILNRAASLANDEDVYWHWVFWIFEWLDSIGHAQVKAMGRITVQLGSLPAQRPPDEKVIATLIDLGGVLGELALECLELGIKCDVRFDLMGVIRVTKKIHIPLAPSCLVEITNLGNQDQVDVAKMATFAEGDDWQATVFRKEIKERSALIGCLFDDIREEMLDAVKL